MSDTQLKEMQKDIAEISKNVNRLLSWAEGDRDIGTPSVEDKINRVDNGITTTRKIAYNNSNNIEILSRDVDQNKQDIKAIKGTSAVLGAGSGGIFTIVIQAIKSLVQ